MTLTRFVSTLGPMSGALLLCATSLATTLPCTAGQPVAGSSKEIVRAKASQLLENVRAEVKDARDRAADLQSFERDPYLSWESHARELRRIKADVNGIGANLRNLEQIRAAASPWEKESIDQTALASQSMARNTEGAIAFVNGHQDALWLPAYENYANRLYSVSAHLDRSLSSYREFAKVHAEDLRLAHSLGMHAGS